MDFIESKKMLEKHKINFVKGKLVSNKKELNKALKELKFPVAMKIVSEQISHKTDIGGVALNVLNTKQAEKEFDKIMKNAKKVKNAEIKGIFVQKFIEGKQIIIGGKNDVQFGPTIMFGLGGIFVELMKDVSLRICPITREDAKEMIQEIKGFALLKGLRGEKSVNLKEIENTLMKVNSLMMKEKIKELDINPLIANEKEVVAVDARAIE